MHSTAVPMVSEVAGLNKHTHTIMHTITGYSYKPMAVTLHSFVEGQHIQKQNGQFIKRNNGHIESTRTG